MFLEFVVVDETEEGLEYEKEYYGGAKYGVGSSCGFVKLWMVSTRTDGRNRDEGKKERENIQIPSIVPT